jgi:hypothetical protein
MIVDAWFAKIAAPPRIVTMGFLLHTFLEASGDFLCPFQRSLGGVACRQRRLLGNSDAVMHS